MKRNINTEKEIKMVKKVTFCALFFILLTTIVQDVKPMKAAIAKYQGIMEQYLQDYEDAPAANKPAWNIWKAGANKIIDNFTKLKAPQIAQQFKARVSGVRSKTQDTLDKKIDNLFIDYGNNKITLQQLETKIRPLIAALDKLGPEGKKSSQFHTTDLAFEKTSQATEETIKQNSDFFYEKLQLYNQGKIDLDELQKQVQPQLAKLSKMGDLGKEMAENFKKIIGEIVEKAIVGKQQITKLEDAPGTEKQKNQAIQLNKDLTKTLSKFKTHINTLQTEESQKKIKLETLSDINFGDFINGIREFSADISVNLDDKLISDEQHAILKKQHENATKIIGNMQAWYTSIALSEMYSKIEYTREKIDNITEQANIDEIGSMIAQTIPTYYDLAHETGIEGNFDTDMYLKKALKINDKFGIKETIPDMVEELLALILGVKKFMFDANKDIKLRINIAPAGLHLAGETTNYYTTFRNYITEDPTNIINQYMKDIKKQKTALEQELKQPPKKEPLTITKKMLSDEIEEIGNSLAEHIRAIKKDYYKADFKKPIEATDKVEQQLINLSEEDQKDIKRGLLSLNEYIGESQANLAGKVLKNGWERLAFEVRQIKDIENMFHAVSVKEGFVGILNIIFETAYDNILLGNIESDAYVQLSIVKQSSYYTDLKSHINKIRKSLIDSHQAVLDWLKITKATASTRKYVIKKIGYEIAEKIALHEAMLENYFEKETFMRYGKKHPLELVPNTYIQQLQQEFENLHGK